MTLKFHRPSLVPAFWYTKLGSYPIFDGAALEHPDDLPFKAIQLPADDALRNFLVNVFGDLVEDRSTKAFCQLGFQENTYNPQIQPSSKPFDFVQLRLNGDDLPMLCLGELRAVEKNSRVLDLKP